MIVEEQIRLFGRELDPAKINTQHYYNYMHF